MIANLMTTLLLALGVATGNVSSNVYKGGNAFNHEKTITHHDEKPINKVHESQTLSYNMVNNYVLNGSQHYNNKKYYLNNAVSVDTTLANIYSTTYITDQWNNTNTSVSYAVGIYYITPSIQITNGDVEIRYKQYYSTTNNSIQTVVSQQKVYKTTKDYNQYIDLTVFSTQANGTENQTALSDLATRLWNGTEPGLTTIYDQTAYRNVPGSNTYYSNTITLNTLTEPFTLLYVNLNYIQTSNVNPQLQVDMDEFTLEGEILPVNYEIVDIPDLLFTILTMPFSFYSTAFNLTIFPGTPYALNFGNLVLTIVAAMILLYLIRKIIK